MNIENKKVLISLLDEYAKMRHKTCEYDCYNCDMGILESYGSGHSCALDIVTNNIEYEINN